MQKFQSILPILHAVTQASQAVLKIYHSPFTVQTKSDDTPVTAADLEANAILQQALLENYPSIAVVSEESLSPFHGQAPSRFFLVDPVDGTRDFIQRRDEFTVNVALIEAGRVVWGGVAAPALGELFYGVVGEGARLCPLFSDNREGVELKVPLPKWSPQNAGMDPVRVLVSVNHRDPQTDSWVKKFPHAIPVSVGSSLKFCRLAQGFAHYYPRQNSLHEWDIAAGHGVLKAAGGNVFYTGTTDELTYGHSDFLTEPFEAY